MSVYLGCYFGISTIILVSNLVLSKLCISLQVMSNADDWSLKDFFFFWSSNHVWLRSLFLMLTFSSTITILTSLFRPFHSRCSLSCIYCFSQSWKNVDVLFLLRISELVWLCKKIHKRFIKAKMSSYRDVWPELKAGGSRRCVQQ